MSATDELLRNNEAYARSFRQGGLPPSPSKGVAVIACMDARIDVYRVLGLELGEVHVIRNAGGVVTEDVVRSLLLSQRLLGTTEVILLHHTDCGMTGFEDDALKDEIEAETGHRPPFALGSFRHVEAELQRSIARLLASPFVPCKTSVRGFVYDVRTGRLYEVEGTGERRPG